MHNLCFLIIKARKAICGNFKRKNNSLMTAPGFEPRSLPYRALKYNVKKGENVKV